MLLRRELLSRQVWLEVENSLLGSKIWFFKPMTYKSLSPQDWSIEHCLRPEAARLIYLKWWPLLALERQTCFTWSRQKEADFTWLCIVWLQCFFGIKHSLLLQCALGQLHLCPIAQLTLRCWVLSLQSLELPPAFPPKMCPFTQQIFTNSLPCAGPCGEHKDESDVGPVHKCCQSSKGHLAVGQARGRFYHHGPQNSAVCCMFLEGEGD